jgi:glutamyl-tRNA reductase
MHGAPRAFPPIVAVGTSHRRTPISVRERLTRPAADSQDLDAAVLLATCNRFEAYTTARSAKEGLDRLISLMRRRWDGPWEELAPYLDVYRGEEAVRHLFRVAAGLDSLVLGEAEVLGQVGAALRAATSSMSAGRELARLFGHAVRVGRRARAETGIGRQAGSVSSVAVRLARETLGALQGRRVLVVGAGEAATLSVRALAAAGACDVTVVNRTRERAAIAAAEVGGRVVSWEGLHEALREADVVVTAASSSDGYLLGPDDLRAALTGRASGEGVLVLDIAVPRAVDPAAAFLPRAHLFNVDDLQAVRDAGLDQRRQEVERVEGIIEEELGRFHAWWREMQAAPTLRALHEQAEAVRTRELAKALRKLPGLTPDERTTVEALTRSLIGKLLHNPIASLKDGLGDAEHLAATRRLFRLAAEADRGERVDRDERI